MIFGTSEKLTEEQVQTGMKRVIKEGLTVEAMATLTGGAFLVAMAIELGASNFQIGLLAGLPTISNIFQIVAIYLVRRYSNRRAISVFSSLFARLPLLLIACLPFLFSAGTSLVMMITLLFVHYFFSTITGLSWNSWMKDLVPERMLGSFFSKRGRLLQIINVTLSLGVALVLDHVKNVYPDYEMLTYSIMFSSGSLIGLVGLFFLAKTPEPTLELDKNLNIFKFFKNPLKNTNFRNFIIFNSFWKFAVGLATPFFSVYLLKVLDVKISYVIALNILSQASSIFFIKRWGRYCDKYSNKTTLAFCAPLYIFAIFTYCFTTMPDRHAFTIPLLIIIHIVLGLSSAGIELAMGNIMYKLAPKKESITYISTRSMITNFFSAIAPIVGGLLADFFTTQQISWNIEWKGASSSFLIPILELKSWDFFFVIGSVLAIISLQRLSKVSEEGEIHKKVLLSDIKTNFREGTRIKTRALKRMVSRPVIISNGYQRRKQG